MVKMYNAEVLSKFPVVQHFPFGSLFSWEQDPNAAPATQSVHTTNHPISQSKTSNAPTTRQPPQEGTKAPWAQASGASVAPMTAPWASQPPGGGMVPTAAPWAKPSSAVPQTGMPHTRASQTSNETPGSAQVPIRTAPPEGPTRAPWADHKSSRRR